MAGRRSHPSPTGSAFLVFHFLLFFLTSSFCSAKIFKIDPNTVDLETREMWCAMEQQTCSLICNEPAQLDKKDNYCNATTLEYKCRCKAFEPPMERYEFTLPTFMCTKTHDDCVKNNQGDLVAQNNCTVTIKRFCGDLTPVPGGVSGVLGESDESEDTTSRDGGSLSKTSATKTATETIASSTGMISDGEKTLSPEPSKHPAKDTVSSASKSSGDAEDGEEEEDGKPGRDKGAKVGIAVGTIGGVALLACIIYILRLRKKAALAGAESSAHNKTTQDPAEIESGGGLPASTGSQEDGARQLYSSGKPELDGKALDGGKQWIVEGAVEMEAPGAVEGVPQGVYEMEVVSPAELDATGNTFQLGGVIEKKSWIGYGSGSQASSSDNLDEMGMVGERPESATRTTSRVSLLEGQGVGATEKRSGGNGVV